MGVLTIFVLGLILITQTISADSVLSQNVTRSFNLSPIPVSTKLIARTKVPLFMNSRGSYTVTKILEDTNTTSSDSLQSSSPVTLVTFAPFTKSLNYSTLAKTTAAAKVSKMNKITKALTKTSPMILVSPTTTTIVQSTTTRNLPTTTKLQLTTSKPSSTTTVKVVTVPVDASNKKNKLSMSKLAVMAATLTADATTTKTSINTTEHQRKASTAKPTKPKKDKSKNPKNKHAKHQSTSPKPKNSKYNKKKPARKSKGKKSKSKPNKSNKRKNKNGKNENGKRHTHTRKYRQTDDFSGCHPYWNPKPNCDKQQFTSKPGYRTRQKIVKRRVRSQKNTLALHAFNTLKKVNTYFRMF